MKKYKSLLLAVIGLLCSISVSAHDFEVEGIYYNITSAEDKTVEVTYSGDSYDAVEEYSGSITIPETVTYNDNTYSVTSIGWCAFDGCSSLTSVEIPNSVTSIWSSAFEDCSGLTSVEIPNSVTSIGRWVFSGCSGLTSVEIGNSVTSIGDGAFWGCSGLTSVVIPNSVTSIGGDAFAECSSLTSVVIPNSVTSIGDYAFNDCYGLTSVEIPNSVTSIGKAAFSVCYRLTSVQIPNSVTSIGDWAFRNCSSLTSVEIPNSVTSIGDAAFMYCSGLTSVVIGNSVTSIGDYAFCHCDSLTSVEIPNSVTSIGDNAFGGCSRLTSIVVAEDNSRYDSRDNCNAIIETQTNTLIAGCSETTIPNSVTSIGDYTFYDCSSLTSVEIPNSVTSIGDYAFLDCSGLTSIKIPNSVTSIGKAAFEYCSSLTSIKIPNSVTSIGDCAFYDCSGLTSVEIPNSVTSIGDYAFNDCYGLTSVTSHIPANNLFPIKSNVFESVDKSNCTLNVPYGAKEKYESTAGWNEFTNIVELIEISTYYELTYIVDSLVYQTDSVFAGDSIKLPEPPTKEGYTFVGWEGLPDVMPDCDVEVKAKFDVNVYCITYKVDGLTYQTDSISYGATIVPVGAPTKEGHIFIGWEGLPETMPAKDVEVMAKYLQNTVQTDEQGVLYELNTTCDAFEAKGTTDELVADIVLPASIYGVPVNGIAAEAFKDTEIQTIVIPATIQKVGDDAFVGCTELRWVDWQAKAQARAECFDAPEVHGNMLLFCYGEQAPDYAGNVVVNGKAKEIVLMDARPFASPYDYESENISFTKTFTKETMIGTGAGWEGIVVPFDVERIVFGEKVIAPFGATGQYSDIPCWLAQMKDENFVMTDAIKADKAYIMAVPNSEAYDDDYNVEGDVKFEATNAVVKATANSITAPANKHALVGTYEPVEIDADVFALNDDDYLDAEEDLVLAPGSVFVQGMREVRPFEAYVRSTKALQMACLKIGSVLPTHITSVQSGKADAEAWYTLQGKRLNTKPVQTGFYLHGGKLEFVRQQ